jgi:molybdate transport system permease protein
MDWQALALSLKLAAWTACVLLPVGLLAGRALAWRRFPGRRLLEAALALPLVLPPTVLGYYLLSAFGTRSALGRAFEAIAPDVRAAAACCGMSPWRIFTDIELPLAWPGVLSALVLTFAHTLGEFGVVLMVGGNIPGETRTIAVAIYDRVQAFDTSAAGMMAAVLLALSLVAIAIAYSTARRAVPAHG